MAQVLPPWLEAFVIGALKRYLTPEMARAEFLDLKAKFGAWLATEAAKTVPTWDDAIVAKVMAALDTCDPNADLLCGLITMGEKGMVAILREAAAKSPTLIDDMAVDLVAAALAV